MSMIEQIARTMAACRNHTDGDCAWKDFTDDAKAVLQEMLNPTQPMIDAADELAGTIAPMDAYSAAIEAALAEAQ